MCVSFLQLTQAQTTQFLSTFKLPANFRTQKFVAAQRPVGAAAPVGARLPSGEAGGLFDSVGPIWPTAPPLSEEIDLEDD